MTVAARSRGLFVKPGRSRPVAVAAPSLGEALPAAGPPRPRRRQRPDWAEAILAWPISVYFLALPLGTAFSLAVSPRPTRSLHYLFGEASQPVVRVGLLLIAPSLCSVKKF